MLFCCRSCLKGEQDTLYYDMLGLDDRKATAEAIKKAYKMKSLELHPDRLARKGIQVTPEHNQQFQKLKEAYDVLSDPRKRRLYDQLGASGMKLIDSPQDVNPQELIRNFQSNRGDRIKIGILVTLIFCAILIFPILFCLKCDGRLDNAPWLAIWTPMWLVNAIMVISSLLYLLEKEDDPTPNHDDSTSPPEKVPLITKLHLTAQSITFVMIQILVLLRLDHQITSSWFNVFIPWYIYEALALVEKLPVAIPPIPPLDPSVYTAKAYVDEESGDTITPDIHIVLLETERHTKLVEQIAVRVSAVASLLRVWFALLVAARLDHDIQWDWGAVMVPVWIYFGVEIICAYVLRQWGAALVEEADVDVAALEEGGETDPIKMMKFQHGMVCGGGGLARHIVTSNCISICLSIIIYLEISHSFHLLYPSISFFVCLFE